MQDILTPEQVARMFDRAFAIGQRNPGLEDETVLMELDELDNERPSSITYPPRLRSCV